MTPSGRPIEFFPVTYNTPGDPTSGMLNDPPYWPHMAEFAHDIVAAGRDVYIMMVPSGSGDYTAEVVDSFNRLAALVNSYGYTNPANTSESLLHSAKVHIILTVYTKSNHDVGFIMGGNGTGYTNSVLSAKASLVAYRSFGSY